MSAQVIFFIVYSLFTIVILPFTLFNFLILNTPFLSNIKSYVVTSGSMEPSISQGSLIYTFQKANYKDGEIVTFKDSIGLVTHRIIKTISLSNAMYYSTKGDANPIYDDELISEENIYGKTFAVIPYLGEAILILKNL